MKTSVLAQFTPLGQGIVCFIGQFFIVSFTFNRVTKKTYFAQHINQYVIFDPVSFFYHCSRAAVS